MRWLALFLVAGCGDAVSPPDLGDYETWHRVDVYGEIPGHGDSYRIIYVNDIARNSGTTELDATLVKEVRDNNGGEPGDLRIIEIMRKTKAGTDPGDEGGWLFTQMPEPGGDEVHRDLCWARCHRQAPFAGAWFDYTK